MKLKVLRDFCDKKEKFKLRKTGEEFDADKTRADELIGKGLVEPIIEKPNKNR